MHHSIKDKFIKGTSDGAGIKEKQEMLSLFHRQGDEFELKNLLLEDLENTTANSGSFPESSKIFLRLWRKIYKSECNDSPMPCWFYPLIRVAAALVIGFVIGVYITSLLNRQDPVYYTAHSPAGSISEWTLPDGTIIFLNAGSEIKYSSETRGPRTVHLTGEAWFDVAQDKKRPFIVSTPWYDIKVTGTKFNVKAYEIDREVITTLEKGKIILMSTGDFRFGDDITLQPGEQAVFDKNSRELALKNVNTRWYTSWKDNKLIFMNMDLKDLIVLLERKYGVNIVVKNPDILSYHCDGTFKNETIIEVLEIIKKTLPINYNIVGQQIEITSK
jgi:ferric-dicitrate binding protein FerR (iron transport regulator)